MKVAVEVCGSREEPYLPVHEEHVLSMLLRPGLMEVGLSRSAMKRVTFEAGVMGLCTPYSELWIGSAEMEHADGQPVPYPNNQVPVITLSISDVALMAACDGAIGEVALQPHSKLVDTRLSALVTAVNAERVAHFPNGRLFLDSVEQAIAVALVKGYAVRQPSARIYRGGLTSARLRRIKELVRANIDDDLTLENMAQAVELSTAHFGQMFRKSTGQSPHQYVLRRRAERAKEMLGSAEARVLDVAVTCGFKTQQHFARVFRRMYGVSPTEYRQQLLGQKRPTL